MNDRFMVRYWCKTSKKYLNSHKLVYNDGTYTQVSTKQSPNGTYYSYILYDWNASELIPEQCTGLHDKNGKLIYEGDIIQTPSQRFFLKVDDFSVLAVVYPDFSDSFDWSEFVREIYYKERQGFIEVIGNIHENPELLEGIK